VKEDSMSSPEPPPPSAPPPVIAGPDPRDNVKGPAIALMVVSGIAGAFAILGVLMALVSEPPDVEMPEFMETMMRTDVRIISGMVAFIFNAFVFFAAMQMKQLQSWGLALAGSIIAMTPCISLCCIFGLPIGIWSLMVLFKPEVKEGFS
jgi:hypothetical protein